MNAPTIPDYVAPIVGYRVWNWHDNELWSLNGEAWLPNQAFVAKCPSARHEPTPYDCSCGVHAAKDFEHLLKMFSAKFVEDFVHGEVHLWGEVVEHDLGYRAQFAYPKSLVLPFNLPSSVGPRLESSRLETLMVYGADISLAPNILLWTKRSGYTSAGSDWLKGRGKPCGKWCEQWHERTLQMGDYVTVLGRGIGLVERDDSAPSDTVCIRLRNDYVFIVPQEGIVWNCQTWRWEVERWDVELSGYRDKGCPLLIRRKSESSNGRGSNSRSSSSGSSASIVTSSPKDDDLDVRLKEYWEKWEQRNLQRAPSSVCRTSDDANQVADAACEQVCGICGSLAVRFDWARDLHVCETCGGHETTAGWQKTVERVGVQCREHAHKKLCRGFAEHLEYGRLKLANRTSDTAPIRRRENLTTYYSDADNIDAQNKLRHAWKYLDRPELSSESAQADADAQSILDEASQTLDQTFSQELLERSLPRGEDR